MQIDFSRFSATDALNFLCLCLAQPERPHVALGFRSMNEAFDVISAKFGSKPNTVKSTRDAFDRYTDSDRVGWDRPLRPALKRIWELSSGMSAAEIVEAGKELLARTWSEQSAVGKVALELRLEKAFAVPEFSAIVEETHLAWGFKNRTGYIFKVSTADLVEAFESILEYWSDWTAKNLNINSNNPDVTFNDFARQHFKPGAAQALANVQRRGFLHLISAIAFVCSNDSAFDPAASKHPLPREFYEKALEVLKDTDAAGKDRLRNVVVTSLPEAVRKSAHVGRNLIIYGAPGTGKSYKVDELAGEGNVVRTVFHPDTQNSDFFGCLKPRMDGSKVVYRFAPGPFARSVCNAMLDQQHQHFLVIEELNRAPAAAVFGELFQLLDRTDDGSGKYKVDFPNEESAEWFAAAGVDIERLCLPSNLTIYATMNSADQGVYPLDTAFRRRWEQQYLPLEGEAGPLGKIHFASKGGVRTIEWRAFVGALNSHLVSEFSVAEDRLLGLWFLKATELGGGVPAKILLYLWDDLLRHEDRTKAFAKGVRTYGQMNKAIEAGQPIFSDDLLARLEDLADKSVALQSDTSAPADDPDLSPDDDASL